MTTAAQWDRHKARQKKEKDTRVAKDEGKAAALLANVPKGGNKAVNAIKVKCHLKNAAVGYPKKDEEEKDLLGGRGERRRSHIGSQDRLTLMLCFRNRQSHCLLGTRKPPPQPPPPPQAECLNYQRVPE